MSEPVTFHDNVLSALERLLAWPELARSPQLGKFLDYIVRRKIEGQEQAIKAYAIAVDVLGRPADFDPQADPIVRVQARRLRSLLDQYYAGDGLAETLRIELPVGRYVPEFVSLIADDVGLPAVERMAPLPARIQSRRSYAAGGLTVSWFAMLVAVAGVLVLALALSAFWPRSSNMSAGMVALQPPTLTVVEFQNLGGLAGRAPPSGGLAIELVTDLEHFDEIKVRYGGGSEVLAADSPSSDFVLTGIVRPDGDLVQYSAILTDVNSGLVVWNHSIAETSEDIAQPGVLDDVSRKLSLLLGSAHGPLHQRVRALLAAPDAPELGATDYLCLMRFHRYRDTGASDDAARVDNCLTALGTQQDPDARFLAMQASLLVDSMGASNGERLSNPVSLSQAESKLDAAVSMDPTNAFVWEQYARLRIAAGDLVRARAAYSAAVQLNPANADALASYALELALSGDLAEAEPMADDALNSAEDPPAWYFGAPTLLSLRRGDVEEAGRYAESYAQADRELGPILAIMAGQRNHDGPMVNRYVAQVLDVPSFRVRGVLPRLRERVSDPGLIEQIRIALLAAGVPQTTLAGNF